jgi:excisionase family DNA binding protein
MPESYYRTGQAAKQLGISSYHVRRLCEAGEVEAELTTGGQWKINVSEISRLKREGVPPVPVELENEHISLSHHDDSNGLRNVPDGLYAEPSDQVIEAAEEVKIMENRIRKRRLDQEAEEVEDWFRERAQRQAVQEEKERRRMEASQDEQRRREWADRWIQYALDSLPHNVPKEIALDVHAAVREALADLQPSQSKQLIERLVNGAVERALGPWKGKEDISRAIKAAHDRLPWDVQYRAEHASLKQRAIEAAMAAVGRLREGATYNEMETATVQAVQPMVKEYDHHQACQRSLSSIYLSGATSDEREEARKVVSKTFSDLPIGASQRDIEKARETALAPILTRISQRMENARLEDERRRKKSAAEFKASLYLDHIARYLDQEYDFDGDYTELRKEADRLRDPVRNDLIQELIDDPDMQPKEIRECIETMVDEYL